MNRVLVHDKEFELYIPETQIEQEISRMAAEISADFRGRDPVFIAVLNGSFMLAASLLRRLEFPCEISFVKLASYSGTSSTREVHQLIGLKEDLRGRNVIILEDIVDTGLTVARLRDQLSQHVPADLRVASLLFKPQAFREHFRIDYCGFEIPNDFIVGFGLDYDGYGRNLPDIYRITTN